MKRDMRLERWLLTGVLTIAAPCPTLGQEASETPQKLLAQAAQAAEQDARDILKKIVATLREEKDLPDRAKFARRFAEVLARVVHRPEHAQAIFGMSEKTVARQVVFHRYIEQWTYDHPLSICLVFDYRKGSDPKLSGAHALQGVN
jgi:hypothetical protein